MEKKCNCGYQIIWWFDNKPTVLVCYECQIALLYRPYDTNEECPFCGGPITIFEANEVNMVKEEK